MRIASYDISGPHPLQTGEVTVADEDVGPAVDGFWKVPGNRGYALLLLA